MNNLKRHSKRVFTAVVGGSVMLIGIVLIPYPGPGWLIVFAGLAILSTEFEFASRALDWLKTKYDRWVDWLKHQHHWVQLAILGLTGLVLILTIWLLNTFGLLNALFHLNQPWLVSPLFR